MEAADMRCNLQQTINFAMKCLYQKAGPSHASPVIACRQPSTYHNGFNQHPMGCASGLCFVLCQSLVILRSRSRSDGN